MKRFLWILLLPAFGVTADTAGDTPIKKLDYKNPVLRKLREEVKTNLRASRNRNGREVGETLHFYSYQVREKDTFFRIMAMTGMDLDTLSSVNSLSSPMDIHTGMELRIPNARGVFVSEEEMPELLKRNPFHKSMARFDELKKMWFVPGIKPGKEERSFFYGFAFMRPLNGGRLSSGYGHRSDPFTSRRTFHGGVDLAAGKNSPVYASADGEVVFAGRKGGYGKLVIIRHAHGYETRYGHLNRFDVHKGDRVKKGEEIAGVGNTGRSTGFHLHFEVRRFEKRQRPIFHAFLSERDLHRK